MRREACRSCNSNRLKPVLDLGSLPIANALLRSLDEAVSELRYPLEVAFCEDCALVQILHDVPLFPEDYPYYSSYSDALLAHARAHAEGLTERLHLGPDSFVVEIASNDGYLLRNFTERGIPALGIDPAPGPAAAATEIGVETMCDFFGRALAHKVRAERGPADVIIANNVMAHVPDLNDLAAGYAILLADHGVLTVENPGVGALIEHGEFDTIYHEHVCYYSCSSMRGLMERHGLSLFDVEEFPALHGGTLRWWIGRDRPPSERLLTRLGDEKRRGMTTFKYYAQFGRRVQATQDKLRELLTRLKGEGRSIAAYGAAAKGATLLNSTGIGREVVDFVVDRNVHKQGKLMPGTHQPILGVEALVERRPDYTLLLAWNFAAEITAQQAHYRELGGRFIVPVPEPAVLG